MTNVCWCSGDAMQYWTVFFFFLKWQKILLVHSLFNLSLLVYTQLNAGIGGLPACGLSTTDTEEAEGLAQPRWQQQTSATTDNHILHETPHLFFFSVTVTEWRTNKAVTAPDSHSVFILNTWKTSETKQGIFCTAAQLPSHSREGPHVSPQALHAAERPAESKTIVLLFASWYISLPRNSA